MVPLVFRRRTTDQVYATLQQVQRRISEAGAGQPNPGTQSYGVRPMPPVPAVRPTPLPIPRTSPPVDSGAQASPAMPVPPAPVPLAPPMSGRTTLQLPASLAATLAMLWIASCIVFYVAGVYFPMGSRSNAGPAAHAAPPAEDTGTNAQPVAEKPTAKGHLLLLKSIPTWGATDKAKFQQEVTNLNAIMVKHAARGWKPLFAVREPSSGQLQLVFGKDGETWGVDKDAWRDFQKVMATPAPNGGGFAAASWIPAE
jgi:hypothetical protein